MKNSMIIFAFLVICAGTSFSQSYKPYPIPSFAVPIAILITFGKVIKKQFYYNLQIG
jgi:hypothetical protein